IHFAVVSTSTAAIFLSFIRSVVVPASTTSVFLPFIRSAAVLTSTTAKLIYFTAGSFKPPQNTANRCKNRQYCPFSAVYSTVTTKPPLFAEFVVVNIAWLHNPNGEFTLKLASFLYLDLNQNHAANLFKRYGNVSSLKDFVLSVG
ncbi:hypothetical protein PIB30_062225, partial [Stylosanthes scabra]|nr:hypothetical protein [Stylosanthes scabra]